MKGSVKKTARNMCLLLCFILIFSMACACESDEEKAIKEAVNDFLTSYQSADPSAGEYLANRFGKPEIEFNGVQKIIAKRMRFTLGNIKKADNGYLVSTKIESIDFKKAFESVVSDMSDTISAESILSDVNERLLLDTVSFREFSIEISVQKIEDKYQIILTPELSNALLGGYNEYLTEITGGMLNE